MSQPERPLWEPSRTRVARSNIVRFARWLQEMQDMQGVTVLGPDGALDYDALHAWSVAFPERFWPAVWKFCGVVAEERPRLEPWDEVVRGLDRMAPPSAELGPRWFDGARLNFAENLLRHDHDRDAVVAWNERGRYATLSHRALRREVQRAAAALRAHGVGPGDRVAAFLPNIPEAIIAMLATASLGAIWSSCSPDFGVNGVRDRFGQIAPRILIACDGYRYAGKEIDTLARVREIASRIPDIERVVIVPSLQADSGTEGVRGGVRWDDWLSDAAPLMDDPAPMEFARLPFDHPLFIMYSSGTTGLPKCMVHGAGGTLLQHLKEHVLHTDLTRADRIFYFTTCGWMMWNWLVSALAVGAAVVLYDGAPMAPAAEGVANAGVAAGGAGAEGLPASSGSAGLLWQMAEAERVTVFGTSAKYLALAEKEGLHPGASHDLSALRTILSTGSPLAPPSFDYVYRELSDDVCLSSISGGTDIISCFALGNPAGAVWRGELQARGLGMKVEIFDERGVPVSGEPGELVCTMPFPSMPVCFWNDADGSRYRAAYFEAYPNVWRHGDWAQDTPHGGLVISGRSDATLNPGGVRIGTAEIYRQVEQLPEVVESLVVGQEMGRAGEGAGDARVVLFVRLRAGVTLDDALRTRIRGQI
ncbi:MAG: acetoacetate--CoA ligase, partial [Gemmatimonadaceae bacterium]